MPRNAFAFLDTESKDRTLLLLLLALIRKQGGEVSLSLADLTAIEDGASFHKYPDDTGTSLVLRFARKGAEAYFLSATAEVESSQPTKSRTSRPSIASQETPPSPRHAIHDDMDLAMREEEMATRSELAQREKLRQARAEAGAVPWRTVPPTRQ
jgi:hypothetical protein